MEWNESHQHDFERPWQEGESPAGCLLSLAIVILVAAALVSVAGV